MASNALYGAEARRMDSSGCEDGWKAACAVCRVVMCVEGRAIKVMGALRRMGGARRFGAMQSNVLHCIASRRIALHCNVMIHEMGIMFGKVQVLEGWVEIKVEA